MTTLTPVELAFLQRLANQQPAKSTTSQVARYFMDHFGLGTLCGRSIEYSANDHSRAKSLLQVHRQSFTPLPKGIKRAQSVRAGMTEKTGAMAPHHDSLAIKCAAGQCSLLGTHENIPSTGYCVLTRAQADHVGADRLMVVENMETFRDLSLNHWIDYQGLSVLAIFRGDTRFKADEVLSFLQARTEPVWAFVDFDPAGLGIANALPRLERLVLPAPNDLMHMVRNAERRDLYVNQAPQWYEFLDRNSTDIIQPAWNLLKALRMGLPQEQLIHPIKE
jgi:hypothetical protein